MCQDLDLGHNELTSLPDSLGDLVELTDCLYLHGNNLSRLPDTLGNLTRLRYLNVGENPLTALPETVGRMTELIELRAQHSRLTGLPDTIAAASANCANSGCEGTHSTPCRRR
ncbi:hypothetical protein [Streptomyces mordarskii]|uniref:leucine-rich repeat domain-containing protein n=1 Tax=Streptomyces mordarskii TaxID=1226758 RepID=UPI0031F7BC5D